MSLLEKFAVHAENARRMEEGLELHVYTHSDAWPEAIAGRVRELGAVRSTFFDRCVDGAFGDAWFEDSFHEAPQAADEAVLAALRAVDRELDAPSEAVVRRAVEAVEEAIGVYRARIAGGAS